MKQLLLILLVQVFILSTVAAQDNATTLDKITGFPAKFLDKLSRKANDLEVKIIAKTEKALRRLEKQEQKLKKKLAKKDSLAAAQLFAESEQTYQQLRSKLSKGEQFLSKSNLNNYVPYFDTLKTSLNFLQQEGDKYFSQAAALKGKLTGSLDKLSALDGKLNQANAIRDYIKQRRAHLKEKLGQFGFAKELKKINKEVYYYSQQLQEYKNILKDPEKLEQKAIGLIRQLPAFRDFMQKHSELAALFPDNGLYGTPQGLAGLQTRNDIQALLQGRIAAAGPNANQLIQQNIQQAQAQLSQLKNKINELGGGSSDMEMPDFKRPNAQKTKSFWKRLELGTNLQNTRGNNFLPITTDLGLSLGYKLNDKSSFGVGASYKMGWGNDIRRITVTHEGIGLRSYIDFKLKGSFFISGGYEQNYRHRFNNIQQLTIQPDYWTQSGLVGIKKKYSIGKKYKGNMQLLFDFLYKNHAPQTQPILFRLGYGL
jgi:hypothetical protein